MFGLFVYFSCLCVKPRYNNSKIYPVLYTTYSSFLNPGPLAEDITTGTEALACGIQEHLKSKSIQRTIIILCHDVYNVFLKAKVQLVTRKVAFNWKEMTLTYAAFQ